MKCKYCGADNPRGAVYCSNCQARIPAKQGMSGSGFNIILICVCVLVLLITAMFTVIKIGNQEETVQETVQEAEPFALGYVQAVRQLMAENDIQYGEKGSNFRGIFQDLDQDGMGELAVVYLCANEEAPGFSCWKLSVFDYKDDTVKIRVDGKKFADDGAAGMDSRVGVLVNDGEYFLLTYKEAGETNGSAGIGPNRSGMATFYDTNTWDYHEILELERNNGVMKFVADGQEIGEHEMLTLLKDYKDLKAVWADDYSLLEFPDATVPMVDILMEFHLEFGTGRPVIVPMPESNGQTIIFEVPEEKPEDPGLELLPDITIQTEATAPAQNVQPVLSPGVMIEAGNYHSVYLREDGTVAAVGSDEESEYNNHGLRCDVAGWRDIVQISAASHTVGLRENGTVCAVGVDRYGQCTVSGWTGIKAISAGDNHTMGLREDGTVVAIGNNEHGTCDVSDWRDIVQISAGTDVSYGLTSTGTVVSTGRTGSGQRNVNAWYGITAISGSNYYVAGLRSDGTVVTAGISEEWKADYSQWTDIIAISAGSTHMVGLKSDGTLVACGRNDHGQCDVQGLTDIVDVSVGMYHTFCMRADGSLVAVGSNSFRQCDVAGMAY